ncbi:hypothetical protein GF323_00590 [Candidatus Woesearchaeota archaeon]|nr:hypothetical protein [Candidatus Woesearchaeota archaeon]
MQYAIIISEKDPAGINIRECLLQLCPFKEINRLESHPAHKYRNCRIYTIGEESVRAENIDKKIEADLFIFATRHQSKQGIHSLSCHSPGNWSKADFGGQGSKLCIAPALKLKQAYLELKKHQKSVQDHDITLECTHHGPYLEKPALYIEIGSTEEHWKNKKAGNIIAQVIMNITEKPPLEDQQIAVGIGGPHYCNNFKKIIERTGIAVGHICPKYHLENLDEQLLKQAIEKTKEKVDFILLDWKGLGKEKGRIKNILNKLNIEYKRIDKLMQ